MNNTQIKRFQDIILKYWQNHDGFERQYKESNKKEYLVACLNILDEIDCFDFALSILGYQYNRILGKTGETIDIKIRKKVL